MNKYSPENLKREYLFKCDLCGEEYVAEMSQAEADAWALENWGIENASKDKEARTICGECHKKIWAPVRG